MVPRIFLVLCLSCMLTGCPQENAGTLLVPANHFGSQTHGAAPSRAGVAPAGIAAAARVDSIGRRVALANPELGRQTLFRTIGSPDVEIFHREANGIREIVVTEGLVNECPADGQLAAVLAVQLARLMIENQAAARSASSDERRLPPLDVRIGNDNGGAFGEADQLRRAELAKARREREDRLKQLPAAEPTALARGFLVKAGFAGEELDRARSLLEKASDNSTFARNMLSTPTPQSQSPR